MERPIAQALAEKLFENDYSQPCLKELAITIFRRSDDEALAEEVILLLKGEPIDFVVITALRRCVNRSLKFSRTNTCDKRGGSYPLGVAA